nr:MAG TPA: hypothetical protein [Caudoviricetes sp.]
MSEYKKGRRKTSKYFIKSVKSVSLADIPGGNNWIKLIN